MYYYVSFRRKTYLLYFYYIFFFSRFCVIIVSREIRAVRYYYNDRTGGGPMSEWCLGALAAEKPDYPAFTPKSRRTLNG